MMDDTAITATEACCRKHNLQKLSRRYKDPLLSVQVLLWCYTVILISDGSAVTWLNRIHRMNDGLKENRSSKHYRPSTTGVQCFPRTETRRLFSSGASLGCFKWLKSSVDMVSSCSGLRQLKHPGHTGSNVWQMRVRQRSTHCLWKCYLHINRKSFKQTFVSAGQMRTNNVNHSLFSPLLLCSNSFPVSSYCHCKNRAPWNFQWVRKHLVTSREAQRVRPQPCALTEQACTQLLLRWTWVSSKTTGRGLCQLLRATGCGGERTEKTKHL